MSGRVLIALHLYSRRTWSSRESAQLLFFFVLGSSNCQQLVLKAVCPVHDGNVPSKAATVLARCFKGFPVLCTRLLCGDEGAGLASRALGFRCPLPASTGA
eukprot:1163258-Amphidinium_carterae.1